MTVSMPEPVDLNYSSFLAEAIPRISDWSARLRFERRLQGGRWHPTGFMVFNLENYDDLGILRLHVWPHGERLARPGHPSVHSHCFHLHSEIVHGTYSETLYQANVADSADTESWPGFYVSPPSGDGLDRLIKEDALYSVTNLSGLADYNVGESHSMQAGDYHSTDIARGSFVATLAFLSRPIPGFRDHLVGLDTFELSAERDIVHPRDAAAICDYLW